MRCMTTMDIKGNRPPCVFISYSWEDDDHKQWVHSLADRLLEDGIDVILDQYDLMHGDRLPQFMEQSIAAADRVLIICTPTYKEKSDNRKGGVGYEGHIISGELLTANNERKFIPVIRKGTVLTSIPNCLAGKLGVDLTGQSNYEDNYRDLITTIFGTKKKPSVGKRPSYVSEQQITPPTKQKPVQEDAPIHILGIITDEVTVPKMDGSRGSALYKIPFRLSKTPSRLWAALFIQLWNRPPRFTTMHRPGIARVVGNRIVLDGTTIEEVRDYHRDTLVLCIDEANRREEQILVEKRRQEDQHRQQIQQHVTNVSSIASDIEF